MELLISIVLLALVAAFVLVPLRREASPEEGDELAAERAELEARKEAKYREIRDAQADHAAGKMGDEDFRALDRELRAEAIGILKRMDRLDRDRLH